MGRAPPHADPGHRPPPARHRARLRRLRARHARPRLSRRCRSTTCSAASPASAARRCRRSAGGVARCSTGPSRCASTPTSRPACPGASSPRRRDRGAARRDADGLLQGAQRRLGRGAPASRPSTSSPARPAPIFVKMQCFCFNEQTLQAGRDDGRSRSCSTSIRHIADEPNLKHLNIDHPVLHLLRLARTASPLRQRAPPRRRRNW